ncbi:MAG: NADH-quinone oxidoreductase subunit L [Bacteroidota bacterium]|nr:NADH-quinone oxidoreductase subunit L [Bacteroidota bacterium]MDP4229985.1 NADH-quinone oxidoreductase subunit L [Bacteroidota bacterium]MDP4235212.1 NADH-quinone oxidoreductase subunit L [Bacteroidota bacterium]
MDQLLSLSLIILGLPLLSFVIIIFNQKRLQQKAHLIGIPILGIALALAIYICYSKLSGIPATINWSTKWISFGNVPGVGEWNLMTGIMIDNLTAIMLVVVTLISFLVHLFSSKYMEGDIRYARYFAYLGIFTFSMLGIVIGNNLFALYIFWELVGFSSYALISHWYEKPGPQLASKKAFIVNRVGDVGMWTGLMLVFGTFHTFNFTDIFAAIQHGLPQSFSLLGMSPEATLTAAGVLIFCGAVGKSAQFPLHVWLPDAMEGPTPVSALIHAATMVAAGVYLVCRIFPMLTGDAMLVIAMVGGFTSFLAATIALTANDIKKVLAYSTVSQLGYMIMALGVGAFSAGFFHLTTHAMFKACLFLGSGSVIHAMHHSLHHLHDHHTDPQDMRNMGGLLKKMPITGYTFIIATLAISGIPLMSGFMSKDEILAGATAYSSLQGGIASVLPWIGFGVAMMTAFYMWRQVFMTFFGKPKKPEIYEHIHESPKAMIIPLVILAGLSFWIWYGANPIDPAGGWFMKNWAKTPAQIVPVATAAHFGESHKVETEAPKVEANGAVETHAAEPMEHQEILEHKTHEVAGTGMLISIFMAITGIALAWFLYMKNTALPDKIAKTFAPLYRLSVNKWYIDEFYEFAFVGSFMLFARMCAWFDTNIIDGIVNTVGKSTVVVSKIGGWFDKYIVDGIVNLTAGITQIIGMGFRSVQTGKIQTYLAWTLAGVVIVFAIIAWKL